MTGSERDKEKWTESEKKKELLAAIKSILGPLPSASGVASAIICLWRKKNTPAIK